MKMVLPPSWRTATSKETRVRVDAFSKIRGGDLAVHAVAEEAGTFISLARRMISQAPLWPRSRIFMKCLGTLFS